MLNHIRILSVLFVSFLLCIKLIGQVNTVIHGTGDITISTSKIQVIINIDPWFIEVHDTMDNLICSEKGGHVFVHGTDQIASFLSYDSLGYDTIVKRDPAFYHLYDESVIIGETYKFTCHTEDTDTAVVYLTFINPYSFSVWITLEGTVEAVEHSFTSTEDEHFFGLGECWDAQSLDLKGLSVTLNNRTGTPDQGAYIPFYISTKGYGIMIDNNLNVNFDFTDDSVVTITAPPFVNSYDSTGYFNGTSLQWYFFYGPDLLDVIDRFTDYVSKPALPPSWALFSTWQWRDTNTEDGVYDDANGMREQNIPCGLIWIDRPWAQGSMNMPPPFEWQEDRYPNGSQMFHDLQDMGYKTGVWVARNLYGSFADSANYDSLKIHTHNFIERDNCQMYKIDRGNVQNIDPLFTCQAYYEAWDDVLHGDFVNLPRTVANRAQQYVSGKWPGDNANTYEYPSGIKANIGVMLNLAISGFPFWGGDTGGFPDPPGNNVTIRWAQFSTFCAIFETAGRPYAYTEYYKNIYRQYAELYTRLFPYRWTYARIAHEKGYPITRALALEYPNDPDGYNQKYEYLYGDWILVAPMVSDSFSRDIYLPEGTWYDWWNGDEYHGPKTISNYPAPEDIIPLFVKEGGIIPLINTQQTWMNSTTDTLTFRVFPTDSSCFKIYGDTIVYEGRTETYTNLSTFSNVCWRTDSTIMIMTDTTSRLLIYDIHEKLKPEFIYFNNDLLKYNEELSDINIIKNAWKFDPDNGGTILIMVQDSSVDTFNDIFIWRDSTAYSYNIPPIINFEEPQDGDTLAPETQMTISLQVRDPDGSISTAELFINEISQGVKTSDFSWAFDSLATGQHQLHAITSDDGGKTASDTIYIWVLKKPSQVQQQIYDPHLLTIYPNPINEKSTIQFKVGSETEITINLSDILGNEVKQITRQTYTPGNHQIEFTRDNLICGFYILKFYAYGSLYTRYLIVE